VVKGEKSITEFVTVMEEKSVNISCLLGQFWFYKNMLSFSSFWFKVTWDMK
jgi:hypothetical protein